MLVGKFYLAQVLLFTLQGDNVKDRFLAKKWSTTTIATFVGAMHKAGSVTQSFYQIVTVAHKNKVTHGVL